jgi:hypothetical protein
VAFATRMAGQISVLVSMREIRFVTWGFFQPRQRREIIAFLPDRYVKLSSYIGTLLHSRRSQAQ